jgi:tRNA (guanine-N7-)-methyltransferase
LSQYYRSLAPLLQPESHPRPLDWAGIFGRRAPLELEIGFGNGEYLHRHSLAHPERDMVGVEVAWASAKRALRRLAAPPRPNVRLVLDKAQVALARFFAPQSLAVCRLLFPLPWPNPKQAGQRLCQRDFLDLAADRLAPDGLFLLVTDSCELADWVLDQAQDSALALSLTERPPEWDTKYERKWRETGRRSFYRLAGAKTAHPALPVFEEIEVRAYYRTELDPAGFRPREEVSEDLVVRFKEFIYDSGRAEGLLRTMVIEGHLTQDFYIRLRREPDGRWKVSPAAPARLFPTRGLARALELAAG